ncbi:MAG: hypothetical protein KKA73_02120 [Chloroflexi bacterium]|nr:hypothetical protein [Chloroflexota bacterium]MBU1746462.1 hypothetical protein [Chloroflexota bacterium]
MTPEPTPRRYHAYLLRLWQETPDRPWRASLQEAVTDQRHGFADLDRLLAFLQDETRSPPPGAPPGLRGGADPPS